MTKPKLNCAIYTRKSSEEGLDQSFNSLDAQREACLSYIMSQRHEGWQALSSVYDDGGFSGGNMERPALKRLLADIQSGQVNVVVVYKVDRLTRALADFAKIVESFDQQGVSFVSVTQQFNTTSSMGRLTLNVLLSFAQFEREVSGERIRDKIAASKRKGMWMGGNVPLGYAAKDRSLAPIPAEAKRVVHIYERYLELGSVRELQAELRQQNILSKKSIAASGNERGGCHFSRGALHQLLQNPIYIGQIRHKEVVHTGLHEAIMSEKLWHAVQERMARNRVQRAAKIAANVNLLTGVLFDEHGERLTPTYTVKDGRRYRYYVAASATRVKAKAKLRLPAGDIEDRIAEELSAYLLQHGSSRCGDRLEKRTAAMQLIEKVTVYSDQIDCALKDGRHFSFSYQTAQLQPGQKLQRENASEAESHRLTMLNNFVQGYIWRQKLLEGEAPDVVSIARAEGKNERYVSRLIYLSLVPASSVMRLIRS